MAVTRMAMITFMEGGDLAPDQSLPGSPAYPSQGLPSVPGYPSHGLPSPGHPVHLPVYPFDPTAPGTPDQGLPGTPGHPSLGPIVPGRKFVVKYLACVGLILVPDNSLPETAEPR